MTTGTLLLTRDELMDVQQRINEYLRLSEQRRGSDYEYQVSYAWSLLPSNPAAVVGEDVDAVGPQRMIATTGDHPQSLRDSHSGPAIGDGLRPQPTCSPVGSPSSTNSSAVCLTAQPAAKCRRVVTGEERPCSLPIGRFSVHCAGM